MVDIDEGGRRLLFVAKRASLVGTSLALTTSSCLAPPKDPGLFILQLEPTREQLQRLFFSCEVAKEDSIHCHIHSLLSQAGQIQKRDTYTQR